MKRDTAEPHVSVVYTAMKIDPVNVFVKRRLSLESNRISQHRRSLGLPSANAIPGAATTARSIGSTRTRAAANARFNPVHMVTSTPQCGTSRFGCWTCTVVECDKASEGLLASGDEQFVSTFCGSGRVLVFARRSFTIATLRTASATRVA
jgi:hypothetical protein